MGLGVRRRFVAGIGSDATWDPGKRRHRRARIAAPSVLALALFASGCEGRGEGQISGTLFLRDCPDQDPTYDSKRSSTVVPSPLPDFALNPTYFFVDVQFAQRPGWYPDPRAVDSMFIRLQRSSHKPDRTDVFQLSVHDIDGVLAAQQAALSRGEPGVPIIPPNVSTMNAPLPDDPAESVRADIALNGSCQFSRVEPLMRGHIRFSALGRNVGEEIAAELRVTVEDGRAAREQGSPPPSPNVAGELAGSFRFFISRGQRGYSW